VGGFLTIREAMMVNDHHVGTRPLSRDRPRVWIFTDIELVLAETDGSRAVQRP